MTKRTEKLLSYALLAVNAAAMTVALTYAILTVRQCDRLTSGREETAKPVRYKTLNLLEFPTGRAALTPDPDLVSPAPVIEPWEDDPYIRAYQAGQREAAEDDEYEEGDAEDYIPLDQAVFDLK